MPVVLMGKMPMLRDCRRAVAKQSESATECRPHPSGSARLFALHEKVDFPQNTLMDNQQEQRMREWVRNWEAVGPVLEELRAEAIRRMDTAAAIEQLSDAFESARRHWSPPTTSGLVEQQRLFARLRP